MTYLSGTAFAADFFRVSYQSAQGVELLPGQFGLVQGRGHVGRENGQAGHLGADAGDIGVFPDNLELGLFVGEASLQETVDHFQLGRAADLMFSRPAGLGLHGHQADPGLDAGVHGLLHLGGVHDLEVVSKHRGVDPAQLGRAQQTVRHVGVAAETEELELAGLLHLRGPSLDGRGQFFNAGDAVDEEQVHVVRLQPFQTLIQVFGEVFDLDLVELGDQEDLLPGLGIAGEEAAVALFAQAFAVRLGGVPVGDAPFQGLLQEQLVVDGVEHAAECEAGHLDAGLAQRAFGHGRGLGGRGRRLRGGDGPGHSGPGHGEPGESDGLHEIPASQVTILGFSAHLASFQQVVEN